MSDHSAVKTMILLQSEEHLAKLRLLKLAILSQQAATPEDLVKLVDSQMRAQRQSTERLLELFAWAETRDHQTEQQGGS